MQDAGPQAGAHNPGGTGSWPIFWWPPSQPGHLKTWGVAASQPTISLTPVLSFDECCSFMLFLHAGTSCKPLGIALVQVVTMPGWHAQMASKATCSPAYSTPTYGVVVVVVADVDECQVDLGGCSMACQNTPGSYFCTCLQGYQADPQRYDVCIGEWLTGPITP